MKMAEIVMVPINKIVANPFRELGTYPIIKEKVESLKASIKTVGMWESIIVRPFAGDMYEQAFGHQRIAAANELGIKEVPVIVKELSDEQMVQYMGRENGEDYSADFLIMLNTWEAGLKFSGRERKNIKAVDIARLLGWTSVVASGYDAMTQVARACAGATTLIEEGHLERKDLEGLSVRSAKDIVERALSRMESLERRAKMAGASADDIKTAKSFVGKGVKATTREVASGTVAQKHVAGRVDVNTMAAAGKSKAKRTPLFEVFGRALVDNIARMLDRDSVAERLQEIVKVVSQVVEEDDKVVLRQLDFQLDEVGKRADRWRKRLATDKVKSFPSQAQIGGPR